jgi:RimJ/RimL family protein N-acetyltransferase
MAQTLASVIPYPAQYESDVVLRDGSTLHLRPIRPDDAEALLALHDRLSLQSQKFRFFGLAASYVGEVSRLLQADHDKAFVLVAEAGNRLVGVATYVRDPAQMERAEVSFAIADALQGRGVGTQMLEKLAPIARDHHIQTFDAYVLSDNDRMMRVFLDSGFEVQRRLEGGIFHVTLSLVPTARYEETAAARSQAAATASMKSFFEPRAVAVIGRIASEEKLVRRSCTTSSPGASRAAYSWFVVFPICDCRRPRGNRSPLLRRRRGSDRPARSHVPRLSSQRQRGR